MAIRRRLLDCFAALAMALMLLVAAPAAAQNFPARGDSPILDQAGLLRPEQALDLKSKSEALYAQTGRPLVIVTVKSLDGLEVEDYSTQLFRKWAIGDEKLDNGVLLLVAPNEKKVRIETGYGAEGFLPDILAGRIIRDSIIPKFRQGDMAGGIVAGADAIIAQMKLSPEQAEINAAQARQQERAPQLNIGDIVPAIIIAIVFFSIIGSLAKRSNGRRYRRAYRGGRGVDPWIVLWGLNELSRGSRGGWGGGGGFGGGGWGGGGGGGFGGFGGGSSGGGGASGSW